MQQQQQRQLIICGREREGESKKTSSWWSRKNHIEGPQTWRISERRDGSLISEAGRRRLSASQSTAAPIQSAGADASQSFWWCWITASPWHLRASRGSKKKKKKWAGSVTFPFGANRLQRGEERKELENEKKKKKKKKDDERLSSRGS